MQTGEEALMTVKVHVRICVPNQWQSRKLEEQEANKCCSVDSRSRICCLSLYSPGGTVHLLTDLNTKPPGPTVIYEDNQSAIAMARSPQLHGHAKHISIKYHFILDIATDGRVEVNYCPTQEMIADMLAKGLPKNVLVKFHTMIGFVKCSGSEWGGVLSRALLPVPRIT